VEELKNSMQEASEHLENVDAKKISMGKTVFEGK
jgi:hypothetical protein